VSNPPPLDFGAVFVWGFITGDRYFCMTSPLVFTVFGPSQLWFPSLETYSIPSLITGCRWPNHAKTHKAEQICSPIRDSLRLRNGSHPRGLCCFDL